MSPNRRCIDLTGLVGTSYICERRSRAVADS